MNNFKFFHGFIDFYIDVGGVLLPATRYVEGMTMTINDLPNVQPINEPRGRVFYMNIQYNNNEE